MPTQCEIQTCINNLTSSSDITEMVVLAAETNDVTVDRSIPVAETCNLPDLVANTISVGTVFFVQSLCIPVVAGVGCWMTLDNPGRVVRQDYAAGEAWSWGCDADGQLGDNSIVIKSSPVSVVGGYTDWCQTSAGAQSSSGVRTNGTAWGWGCNGQGRLGDNSIVNKSSPVSVVGGFTDWCQTSTGYHSLGVRQNGTAWAWGLGTCGRLGDNSTVSKSSPVSVVGGFTDWCQVSAGFDQSVAIRQNGTAWAWGSGLCGRLGDNSIVNKSSPVSVVGGFTDWCQVSAGSSLHILGVRENGTAWGWGDGSSGRIGDNTVTNKSSPVSVVGGFTDWCQVSASSAHSLGVRQNGTAWAWGAGNCGGLGDNTVTNKSSPVSVVGGFTDWCQVSVGGQFFSVGIRLNGTAWAWGNNNRGTLGNDTAVNTSSPISVVGGFTDWCQVSAGLSFSLGIRKY
jgi:alpha-tubulin suppressor-like RCC1 family protein